MVARLTPDQKAACSNHVGVSIFKVAYFFIYLFIHLFIQIQSLIFLARNQNLYLNMINGRNAFKNTNTANYRVSQVRSSNFMPITFEQNFISTSVKISKRCLLMLYRVLVFRSSVTGMPPLFGCLFLFLFFFYHFPLRRCGMECG